LKTDNEIKRINIRHILYLDMDYTGVVKSAKLIEYAHGGYMKCVFETPQGNTRQIFSEYETENLFAYLKIDNVDDLVTQDVPLIKDINGDWYIHEPPKMTIPSRIMFNMNRLFIRKGIKKWDYEFTQFDKYSVGPVKKIGKYPYGYTKNSIYAIISINVIITTLAFLSLTGLLGGGITVLANPYNS